MTLKFSLFEKLSRYTQNFIKLSAAVHELSCSLRKKENKKKLRDDVENNTVVATADSNKTTGDGRH